MRDPSKAQLEKLYRDQLYGFMQDARYEGQQLSLRIDDRELSSPLWRQWETANGIARALRKGELTLESAAALAKQKLSAGQVTLGPIQLVEHQEKNSKLELALEGARQGELVGPLVDSSPAFGGDTGTMTFAVWTRKQPAKARPFKEVRGEVEQLLSQQRWRHEVVVVDSELKLDRRSLLYTSDGLPTQVVPLSDGFVVLGPYKLQLSGRQWKEDSPLLRALGQRPIDEAVEWGERLVVRSRDGSFRLMKRDGQEDSLLSSSLGYLKLFPVSPDRLIGVFGDIGPRGVRVSEIDQAGRVLSSREILPKSFPLSCNIVSENQVVARSEATWVLCGNAVVRVGRIGATAYW